MSTQTPAPIRVVLVDDQELVRAGFAMLVDSQPDLAVVGQAADGQSAVEVTAATECDVVLMDVRMPRLDGVEATRIITSRPNPPAIVVLTTFDLDEYAFAAIKAGASAFLLKDAPPPDLLGAIRTVHAGNAVVAPSTTRRLLEHFATSLPDGRAEPEPTGPSGPRQDGRLDELTEREREVLVLVARGLSNVEIAETLVVAETTVKTHIGRLLAKTSSRDRVQLVVLAYDCGLVG